MMEKLIFPDDDEQLVKLAGGQIYTLLSEPGENIKSAASEVFSKSDLASMTPDKDHFAIHLVAMGDQETYGHNKNGDGFPKEALVKYHPTFVSNGHFFREHKNRDAETQGIGIVKASAYNEKMRRVEIVVHGNIKKAAEEFELAKSGKPLSFSMSCRVPYDECSICGNQAKSASAYCDHLKRNMGRYMDGHDKYAFAINDKPTFFDISRVANPADRIAHYISYKFGDDHLKAASTNSVIGGADWADFYGVSLEDQAHTLDKEREEILEKLASLEEWAQHKANFEDSAQAYFFKQSREAGFEGELSNEEIDFLRSLETDKVFSGLAKRGCLLPFKSFCSYVTGMTMEETESDYNVKQACAILPRVFGDMLGGGFPRGIEDLFEPKSCCGSGNCSHQEGSDEVQNFMDSVAKRFSCKANPSRSRIIQITIKAGSSILTPQFYKESSSASESHGWSDEILAGCYGMYKLSALRRLQKEQNGLEDSQLIMAVSQNCSYL